jgi:hypothetical protein
MIAEKAFIFKAGEGKRMQKTSAAEVSRQILPFWRTILAF